MSARPAAGGGRWVDVAPDRLAGWFDRFAARHGELSWEVGAEVVVTRAADGAQAECAVPFPPLRVGSQPVESQPVESQPEGSQPVGQPAPYGGLVAHVTQPRRVGVLLVRLGGHAVGVVEHGRLVGSKVGSRPVHGRAAAGGWSQQRFARRREGQARVALGAAVDVAANVLLPEAPRLDGVRVGGDARALETVLADPLLAPLRALVTGPRLDVPDPRRSVLESVVPQVAAVRIVVRDP